MNPYTALQDVIPPKARKYVYAIFALACLVTAAIKGAQGDWTEFVFLLVGGGTGGMASANTSTGPASETTGVSTDESIG